ncbi:MAG: acyl-CoA thioesterase [Firmicutes bacterium]|nr:acyl-CoA thioesterase [Bacillota bacterium]MCM1400764.1 acyl-CoA thioesterase [Bacteroides sp.]MCM1477611.1 acyl-CoA thioesterase [Bacteroides sp.]
MKSRNYSFEMPMRVRDYEVDCQGIVNNANYLHYMEHTRHEFCRSAGFSFAEMHSRGIDPVLRKVTIEYHTPLGLGQEFLSCTDLHREGARYIFRQDIYTLPEQELAASAEVTVVCTQNGHITRGDELAEAFARYL